MAERGFRLPGASYEDLANIIIAYGTRDEASNPGDVRKLDAVHRSSASRTNGFLVDIGILRGEREKLVTRRGRELGVALYDRDLTETESLWRKVVSTSEFLQNVVSAVKMQDGVSYEGVQAYIAHAAGQPRNKPVMIGSSTIIEILKVASLFDENEGGRISVLHDHLPQDILQPETDPPPRSDAKDPGFQTLEAGDHVPGEATETGFDHGSPDFFPVAGPAPSQDGEGKGPKEAGGNPIVNIHLHINCTPDDLEDLTPRLKAMISSLKEDPAAAADELSLNFGRNDFTS